MERSLVFKFFGIDAGAGREFDKMAGHASATGMAVKRFAAGTALAAGAVAVTSVAMAAKFQTAMELLHTQAGVSTAGVERMSKAVLALAGPTATAPDELAKGLYHIASTGLRGAKALNVLKVAAEGAKIGGANLEDVTNALNAAVVSGIPGVKNVSHAMGTFNAIVGAGDMRMQDLADAFAGTGLLTAVKGFGISLNDVAGALATFGDNGIRGKLAASQLRMAVQAMAKPAATGAAALTAIGLSASSLAKDMQTGGLRKAIDDLHAHLIKAGQGGKKMGETLVAAFGKKAGVGISTLEQELGRFHNKLGEAARGATGFASSWKGYNSTFAASWDRAKAGAQALMIQLGTKLLPVATQLMNWIGQKAIPALSTFGGWLKQNAAWVKPLAIGLGMLVLAFTYPVAAIAALVVGFVILYKRSETLRNAIKVMGHDAVTVWHGMRIAGLAVWHALDAVWRAFANGPLAYVKARFADFAAFWHAHSEEIRQVTRAAWHAVSEVIKLELKLILDIVRPALHILESSFRVTWDVVSGVVKMAWHLIAGVISTEVKIILDVVGVFLDVITGHWGKAWGSLKKLSNDAINGVKSIISNFAKDAINLLYNAGKDIISGLIHGISDAAGGVKNVLADLGKKIISWKGPPAHDKVMLVPAGQAIILGLIHGIKSKTGLVKVSLQQVGHIIAGGIMDGFDSRATGVLHLFSQKMQSLIGRMNTMADNFVAKYKTRVDHARSKLKADINVKRQAAAGIRDSLIGGADISGAFTQDANGNNVLGNVGAFMRGKLGGLKRFLTDLRRLRKMGLAPRLLSMIGNAGPDQGIPLAEQMLSGQAGSIRSLNQSSNAITSTSSAIGNIVAGAQYDKQIKSDRENLRHQLDELRVHSKLLRGIIDAIIATATTPEQMRAALRKLKRDLGHDLGIA